MSANMYMKLSVLIFYSTVACQNRDQDETHFVQRCQMTIDYLKSSQKVSSFIERHTGPEKKFKYKVNPYSIYPELSANDRNYFNDSLYNNFKPQKKPGISVLSNSSFPDYVFFFTELSHNKIYCELFLNLDTYFPINRNGPQYMGESINCIIWFDENNKIEGAKINKIFNN